MPATAVESRGGLLASRVVDHVDRRLVSAGAVGTAHASDLESNAAQQANDDAQLFQPDGQQQRRLQRRLSNERRAQMLSEQRAQQREQHRQQRLRTDAELLRVMRRAPAPIFDYAAASGATHKLRRMVQGMGDETAKYFMSGLEKLFGMYKTGPTANVGAACAAVGSSEANPAADEIVAEQSRASGKHAARNRRRRQRNRQRRLAMEQQ